MEEYSYTSTQILGHTGPVTGSLYISFLQYITSIKKRKRHLVVLSRCRLYVKPPFKLQPEDGFMRAETCSCYVLLFNYILYGKVVLDQTTRRHV